MFGGSAISKQLFDTIGRLVPDGGRILEFGSGGGTKELIKRWDVVSIEHNEKYVIPGHKTIKTVIDRKTGWYHAERVKTALYLGPYDLIIIDGPPNKYRVNIQIDLFENVDCPVIFDDVNRWQDREVMRLFCEQLFFGYEIIKGKEKDFAICKKK